MNVVLSLAGMFAAIIAVGTAAVFLHDLVERRRLDGGWIRRGQRSGGGRGGSLVISGAVRATERRSLARGGQVVYVRAGGHVSTPSASSLTFAEQRRLDAPVVSVTVRRVAPR